MKPIKSPFDFLLLDLNFLGKFTYLVSFYFLDFFLTFFLKFKIKIWPRNSLFQNYFSFLKSDLDLTLLFFQKETFLADALKVKFYLKYFPIVKEANYYSLEDLPLFIKFMNFYELKRDPILLDYIEKSKNLNPSLSESIVYLLRIFLSNQTGFIKFSKRDMLKWRYHLELTKYNSKSSLFPLSSLENIFNDFFQSNKYHHALSLYLEDKNQNIPDHICFDKNLNQRELFILLPHMFTYKEIVYSWSFNNRELDFIIAQISWEIWAMYTQIDMFIAKKQSQDHYNNIKKFLTSLLMKDLNLNQKQTIHEMIVSIDEWLRL